jgi:hypothetical protein
MTVCTVNHLPAATHCETARCLFAIELSKQSWVMRKLLIALWRLVTIGEVPAGVVLRAA